jgi:hypothetical protein
MPLDFEPIEVKQKKATKNAVINIVTKFTADLITEEIGQDKKGNANKWRFNFWTKEIIKGEDIYKFDYKDFNRFLHAAGYVQMIIEDKDTPTQYELVQVINNVVKRVQRDEIIENLYSWIRSHELPEVENWLIQGASKYFAADVIKSIPAKKIEFIKDTAHEAHLFFTNCFVKVKHNKADNSTEIKTHDYKELQGHIWQAQIIKRKYVYDKDYMKGDFARFIMLAVNKPLPAHFNQGEFNQVAYNKIYYNDQGKVTDDQGKTTEAMQKLMSICSGIGGSIHHYKSPDNTKLFAIFDAKLNPDQKSLGRTGKSLIFKAIGEVIPVVFIDGKDINFNKDKETFKTITRATKLIVFNDIKPNFDFSNLYHKITEGVTIERKFENPVILSFQDSPKFALAGNFALKGDDDSSLDRQHITELQDYFNKSHKPAHFFKKQFPFGDVYDCWEESEWNKFYTFLIDCIQVYLEFGYIEFPNPNYFYKQLAQTVGEEFLEFFDSDIKKDETKQEIKELHKKFKEQYPDFDKLTQNKFTKWIKAAAKYNGYLVNPYHAKGRIKEDGADKIQVIKKGEAETDKIKYDGQD